MKKENESQKINIPICCDDEFSLDIERIEKKFKKSKSEIIKIFLNKNYFCYMTGFVAGMPFLGDIDKIIQLNRLETPRVKVPKGSVGLTEQFCNIYTFESPGGWNIIGNTPINIFNPTNKKKPNLINPGDEVTFYEIKKKILQNFMTGDYFKIIRGGLNSTFQDQGRKNLYHIGFPFSGVMDKRNYLIANKLINNNKNDPVIEFAFQGPCLKYFGNKRNIVITGECKF